MRLKIAEILLERGLTIADLARHPSLNCPEAWVYSVVTGKADEYGPGLFRMIRIAEILGFDGDVRKLIVDTPETTVETPGKPATGISGSKA